MNPQIVPSLRELGLNVIPLKPKSKAPSISWKKYQNEPYLDTMPNECNLGIVCGNISKNLVVFDIDIPDESLLDKVLPNAKRRTLVVQTGSGKYHIYTRVSNLPKSCKLENELGRIEIKSEGTYVVGISSIHPDTDREYKVISETMEITQIDFEEIQNNLKQIGFGSEKVKGIELVDGGIEEGSRHNNALSYCNFLLFTKKLDVVAVKREIIQWNQSLQPPLPEDEISRIIDDCINYHKNKSDENNQQESIDESERIEREKSETPLQQITRHANSIIKEDPKLVDQILRVCLSTYTDNPINIALLAPSSDGKTYATVEITDLFPKEDVITVGRMSPTALIHQHGELIDKDGNPLQEKLDSIDNQIIETKDKDEIKLLQEQKKNLLKGSKNCVDLKNKIILFLDNPNPATYEMLKPIMSHDKNEISYKTTKGDGSLSVKETVIKNWPVFIFCSAKNEAKNDVWQEIKTRVLMTSPNSSVKKYKEAIRYNSLKRGLPNWASNAYHNDEDEKWAKWHIANYKKKLNELYANGNPIVDVFYSQLSKIFPSSQGDNMRDFGRLSSFIELETVLNADYRPIYELEVNDIVNSAIITTINDIDKACKVLGNIGDLPLEKMKFYDGVFCPLVEKKSSSNSGVLGEIGLTSSELADEYTRITKKRTTSKKILENYLKPFEDAGVLESFPDENRKNRNKYCKVGTITTQNISDLKSKLIEDSKRVDSDVRSCLDLLVKSSTGNQKYNEKITSDNKTISVEELIDIISNNSSKTGEDKS